MTKPTFIVLDMEMDGLYQCEANYVPLTPISFLERASFVYRKSPSIIYGDTVYTWSQTRNRCIKLASALTFLGVNPGEIVAAFAPNIPALYELQFGVPMAGAVLSALNTRLDPPTLAINLHQLEPKIIFVDHQFIQIVLEAFNLQSPEKRAPPRLVVIGGKNCTVAPSNTLNYDDLLSFGKPDFKIIHPNDECDPISISFTSGSTGKNKGVVYSHRAVYLNSLAVIFRYDMKKMPVFLWTVDMFRCNGWCFPWVVAALGGTNVFVREATAEAIFHSIVIHKVTHLCGAPVILDKIASSEQRVIPTKVDVIVAGPLPPSGIISKVESLGFEIHHGYGMTEALGPMTDRTLRISGDDERVRIICREGTHNILMEDVDVKNSDTMISVPSDGKTIGEVVFRGNLVMLGYFKDLEGTKKAFRDGWYKTGDLGIRNPNGDIVMKDRASDSIVTKGEIVSTIDIEHVIKSHPFVAEVAVVGKPDEIAGEIPSAFVTLKDECFLSSNDVIKFCEEKLLPRSMVPINVSFGNLPVNSTGKILKYVLREKAKAIERIPCTNGKKCISNTPL